ncbi:MAG: hypothetical protein ACK41V_00140 [Acidovorax sp.]|uniref:hypothetical protein n=1 Tax=Acidovorax sp. TaxID=1872122 RepID=UPI003919539E
MRNILDLSSWPALLSTVMGLLVATLVMVGVRLVFMQTMQRRRERENRQINERLKTLIAAYKTLGGSFTGQLQVSPTHMRELRVAAQRTAPGLDVTPASAADAIDPGDAMDVDPDTPFSIPNSSDRQRRIRDAVEAALSDVILLGTEEQVQLAATAANEMVAGRSVEVAQLVVSLRQFIRAALDLEPIATSVAIPNQGPLRPGGSSGGAAGKRAGAAERGAGAAGGRAGGGGGGGMGAMALGAGVGVGAGADRVGGETPGNGPP